MLRTDLFGKAPFAFFFSALITVYKVLAVMILTITHIQLYFDHFHFSSNDPHRWPLSFSFVFTFSLKELSCFLFS